LLHSHAFYYHIIIILGWHLQKFLHNMS
jgi:hypothetical protein